MQQLKTTGITGLVGPILVSLIIHKAADPFAKVPYKSKVSQFQTMLQAMFVV